MKSYTFSYSGTITIKAKNQNEAYKKLNNDLLAKHIDNIECENED